MNSRQKEVMQAQLDSEEKTLKELKKIYSQALENCEEKIRELSERTDMENLQSIIYQKRYQEALKAQLEGIMANLQSNSYATVSDYLHRCYRDGYIGTMYDIQGQGIPIIMPIDQQAVTRAIQTDSKLSSGLYSRLGEDVKALKTSVRAELSRGIASGYTWNEIAVEIAKSFKNTPFSKAYNRAMTIARTEGHRVAIQSAMDAQKAAKSKGADVVKQWDATLDDRTRDTHRLLDGQIREIGEMFEAAGKKTEAPGMFGDPSEDCNCRCALFQRARWALDEDELSVLQERAEFWDLDKTDTFEEYREKYLNIHKMRIEFPDDVYKVKGFTNAVKVEVDNAMKKLQTEYERVHLESTISSTSNMFRGTSALTARLNELSAFLHWNELFSISFCCLADAFSSKEMHGMPSLRASLSAKSGTILLRTEGTYVSAVISCSTTNGESTSALLSTSSSPNLLSLYFPCFTSVP